MDDVCRVWPHFIMKQYDLTLFVKSSLLNSLVISMQVSQMNAPINCLVYGNNVQWIEPLQT